MKRLLSLVFALFVPTAASASVPRDPAEVINATKSWLVLIDQGDYRASWQQADASLQAAQPLERWTETVKTMRSQHGTPIMREVTAYKFKSVACDIPTTAAVIHFRAQFERALLKETVTLLLQDGQWRPSDYSLR